MTFLEAEAALDAGKLEMMRPWGDLVRVTRADKTRHFGGVKRIQVRMEADVLTSFSERGDKLGHRCLRVAA